MHLHVNTVSINVKMEEAHAAQPDRSNCAMDPMLTHTVILFLKLFPRYLHHLFLTFSMLYYSYWLTNEFLNCPLFKICPL